MEGVEIKTDDLMVLVNEIVPFHMEVSAPRPSPPRRAGARRRRSEARACV
jgi:hypothetical protein